jgi:putative ABC transport system permease protein
LPENQREVTAVLVLTSSPGDTLFPDLTAGQLANKINEGQVAQAVFPVREIYNLFNIFVQPIEMILLGLTVLIVIVAGIGIMVSIYNSMNDRRHEIAVMRALGAGRSTVMLIVLLESILLSLAGGLLGWLLGHALIAGLNPWIVEQTGVAVGFFQAVPWELVIIPGLILLAALVGYLPAMVAYRTDVAKALVAAP